MNTESPKRYLVFYWDPDKEEYFVKRLPAPESPDNLDGLPDSSSSILWGLPEECQIVGVVGVDRLGAENVEELNVWMNEQEVEFDD